MSEAGLLTHQLVSIAVIFQLAIAVYDDDDISVRDTVYVGLYTASGGKLFSFVVILTL